MSASTQSQRTAKNRANHVWWLAPVAGAVALLIWRDVGNSVPWVWLKVLLLALTYGLTLMLVIDGIVEKDSAGRWRFDPDEFDRKNRRVPADPQVRAAAEAADASGTAQDEARAATLMLGRVITRLVAPGAISSRSELIKVLQHETGGSRANPDGRFDRIEHVRTELQKRIGDEYSDVATRTGWLLTIQAFLVAGLISALNADRFIDEVRQLFAQGIAWVGVVLAVSLTLSIFFGHALIDKLKHSRDKAECLLDTEFGIPRMGVPPDRSTHRVAHFATRALPCLAFAAWAFMLWDLHAGDEGRLLRQKPAKPPVMCCTDRFPPAGGTQGWIPLPPSPAFAVGSADLLKVDPACRDDRTADRERAVKAWADTVATRWRDRPIPAGNDIIVLVGTADRQPLSRDLAQQYESNMGLAHARASEARRRLKALPEPDLAPKGARALAQAQYILLIDGPDYTPPGQTPVAHPCDAPMRADRAVRAWMITVAPATQGP